MRGRSGLFDVRTIDGTREVGVITGRQATLTFAGAPVLVALSWKVLGVAIPALATQRLVPLLLSFLVGMTIYWASARGDTTKEKVIGFVVAVFNCFVIAATTLGIDATMAATSTEPLIGTGG